LILRLGPLEQQERQRKKVGFVEVIRGKRKQQRWQKG